MHFDEPRNIPDPGFAGDTGEADPELAVLLEQHAAGSIPSGQVLARLQDCRLLVPVVAVLGEVEIDEHGLAHDKTSDMAAVLIQSAQGRTGLLSFTSTASLQQWDPESRPVPVPARMAAVAALQDGAAALLVDLAGPARFVVSGEDLDRLAAGWRLVGVGQGYGWIGPTGE
ncbi:MAG: SseB family protein [Nocardioides sp.]|nr:SseB family protein [Nocardioides sp.]